MLDWQGLTLLFVTHDRAFVDKLATRIVELDRGQLTSYDVTQGAKGYARYQELKEQQLLAEEKNNANFDKKLAQEKCGFVKASKPVVPVTKAAYAS